MKMIKELNNILPEAGVRLYKKAYDEVISTGKSDSVASAVAWDVVKSHLVKKDGNLVAMSSAFETPTVYTFELQSFESKIVMNGETEEITLEAVLATTDPNAHGKFFDDKALEELNEQINALGSTLPDVDHEVLMSAVKKHGNNYEAILNEVKSSKGVFKTIRSAIKDGKLWIQAMLDKRYKNHVQKFNALSIEALADADVITGRLHKPKYLGFTFTNNPSIKNIPRFAV